MMRLRRASVIAALPLLAWAATASAECAWVLWAQHPKQSRVWSPDTAYPTYTQCTQRLDWMDRDYRKEKTMGTTRLEATKLMAWSSTSEWAVSWQCLPDSVDPRGPKTN
jgi:hypothetical protein